MNYIGLDFETSGLQPALHVPIQIGISDGEHNFSSLIGGWNWRHQPWTDDFEGRPMAVWSYDSEDVHHIQIDDLLFAPSVELVDGFAAKWVSEHFGDNPRKNIAVGWNVASFDFQFLRKWMPETAKLFSYRSVDLNALVFGLVEAPGSEWSYDALKAHANDRAEHMLYYDHGLAPAFHNAGYDARAAVAGFEVLTNEMKG